MIDDITPLMTRLPDPTPPSTLAATVMARIAREAELKSAVAPAPGRHRERPAWLWVLAGLAVGFCVSAWGWILAGSPPDLTSPRIGLGSQALLPTEGPAALLLALGLLLYLAGLFGLLRSSNRR